MNQDCPLTTQGWLHKIDMAKTEAWQQGYAQGLYRGRAEGAHEALALLEKELTCEFPGAKPGKI